ncbi:class I adenylate-forming enzyme family protein [Rhodococcus sp. T2V]|uniref:class I adenylate-forming enzyme family protein n=1 Tax=Rhodococcus sp. T2V TaxID=3034164 RepID=UPI0023E1107A|nr:class I adenylate-forming enzyme family protein [Rhodococcus sp. T2V]MDF3310061.1 class I adenylate-forming enzyme family protein [Rhodococcus sp. T2V]
MGIELLLDMAAGGFGQRPVAGRLSAGVTPERLREMAQRGGAAVRKSGADAIVYVAGNGPEFVTSLFSAAYAGVPLVPLNYRLGSDQLDGLLSRHPDAYLVVDRASVAADARIPERAVSLTDWWALLDGPAPAEAVVPTGDDSAPAVYIYTSGTTSAPKGVVLRHRNLVSYVLGSTEFASAAEHDAALMSVPPYHIAAVANVLTNLYTGRRLVSLERFDADGWIETVRAEAITSAFVVPTMLARVVSAQGDKHLPSLRSLSYGGAPMPAPVITKALQLWPDVDFVNAYGLTETSSTVSLLGPEDHRLALSSADDVVRARLSSVGQPLPGILLEIRDESGQVVGTGEVGRIHLSGAQVSGEYAGTGSVTDERSFFDTRDLGYLDRDGYLFILGRADDTIIRGAENIAPTEIEEVMIAHPSIQDVAVVGLPDEEWGQRIVAVAILDPNEPAIVPADLRTFVASRLRSSKTPDEIEFWNELPRTETGKLVRRVVTARLLDRSGADSA